MRRNHRDKAGCIQAWVGTGKRAAKGEGAIREISSKNGEAGGGA